MGSLVCRRTVSTGGMPVGLYAEPIDSFEVIMVSIQLQTGCQGAEILEPGQPHLPSFSTSPLTAEVGQLPVDCNIFGLPLNHTSDRDVCRLSARTACAAGEGLLFNQPRVRTTDFRDVRKHTEAPQSSKYLHRVC
jgi:hypothetical protein